MKVAAVTGGGQGIGRATALHFARAGYALSIADPAADAGQDVADLIRSTGGSALFMESDVAFAADVERWMEATLRELGCVDALINNAGISRNRPFLDLTVDEFDRVIAVNLRGTFLCAQAAARQMIEHRRAGAIVNIASTRAFMSEPGTEAYTASRAASWR